MKNLIDLDWSVLDNVQTIGTIGSESGIIIADIEHPKGARITLEKECGNIPFVVTFGIYGLMFHTHYERDLVAALEYISKTKLKINKIFDHFEVPEVERTEIWVTELNSQLEVLGEMT